MTFGSLFAGIGGLDLGLERAGMTCKWQVEIDDYARRVLAKHWPDVRRWDNIKTFVPDTSSERCGTWGPGRIAARRQRRIDSAWAAQWHVDLICGGFPCQDISYAGKGAGLAGERSGLWWEFARVVRTLRPPFVLVENVSALLVRGLDSVLGRLASYGYDAEWACIPAAAVGAPHIRDRVFVLAYAQCPQRGTSGTAGCELEHDADSLQAGWEEDSGWAGVGSQTISDTRSNGLERTFKPFTGEGTATIRRRLANAMRENRSYGGQWYADPADLSESEGNGCQTMHDGETPQPQGTQRGAAESRVGRVAHGVSNRVDRLRGLGNAVVPQVAEWIGRRIMGVADPGLCQTQEGGDS